MTGKTARCVPVRLIIQALCLSVLLGGFARAGQAAVNFVQANSATPPTNQSTVTVPYLSAQTAGNLNVVVVGWNDSTATVSSVVDTSGNIYSLAAAPVVQSGTATQAIYYAKNILGAGAGANSVSVAFSAAARFVDIRVAEYSGLDTANPLDVSAGAQGTSSTANSGSVTTTNANDLLVGANLVQSSTTGPGAGYTSRGITPDGDILEDRVVTATGSYSATAVLDKNQKWVMQMVAFRASTTGPPTISSLSPTSGPAGTVVTISGASFGSSQGTSTVTFNGATASPTGWSASSITVPVPAGATSGNVVVTVGGTASNGVFFTVGTVSNIAFVQTNNSTPQSSPVSVPVAFTASQTAGNLNIVVVGWNDSTATVSSIVDSIGNSYLLAAPPVVTSGIASQAIYYAKNIASAAAGSNTVTVTFSTAARHPDIRIAEYSGLDPQNPLDVSVGAQGNSATSDSGPVTTTSQNDLLVGANLVQSVTLGPGPGFLSRVITADADILEDEVVSTAGSYNATAVLNTVQPWIMQMVAFRAAVGGGGNPVPNISALNPTSGPVGTSVTISGSNFGASQGTSTVTFNGTLAAPTSWSASSITVPVPAGATSGGVVVTVGGTQSNSVIFAVTTPVPNISFLNPSSGPLGTSVAISGSNFGASQGTSTVTFNGVSATPTSWSATNIVAPVPSGATTGNVVVTVSGQASNAVNFTVTPSISSLTPSSGAIGTSITIAGSNFGASQGTSTVTFNGIAAAPTSWSANSIVAPVPNGATTGNVVVTVGGFASNGVAFTVTVPGPSITGLSPTSGTVGTPVTISGANFGTTQGTSTVSFNGTAATPTSWNPSSISVPVPSGATSGNVVVTVGGVASNGVSFTVVPVPNISSLNPVSGQIGTSVVISGTNFGATQGSSTVTFNGIAATVSAWSATGITASVPVTTTGNVVVTVASIPSNAVSFTVLAPSITNLNPSSGPVGTSVTITGSGFGTPQGSSSVSFNGVLASPGSWSSTSIVVPVPASATSGNVVVTVAGMTSNTSNFTVTLPAPAISSLTPSSGPVGASITIAGSNFGATQGTSTVTFNGVLASPTAWTANSITAPVPAAATTGNVVVTVGGAASNGVSFTVTPPPPAITSLNPVSGLVGSFVTISGTNFGSSQGTSTVAFNGTAASPTSWSSTSIVAPVPTGATTGNVVVTVGGQASNGLNFTVQSVASPIALVQHVGKDAGATTSASLAFNSSNTAGNWIAVVIRAGKSGQVLTVSDSRGNAYHQAVVFTENLDGDTLGIFYAENISGGPNTISVSDTILGTLRFAIFEYSGVVTSNSLDVTKTANGTNSSPNTGSVATTAAGDLVLGELTTANAASFTAGSGYQAREFVPAEPNTKLLVEDQVQSAAGSISAGASLSASDNWGAVLAAFKAATGTGGTSPTITSLNPTSGPVGTSVTVTGTNFGTAQGTSTVTFGGVAATPSSWTATSLVAPVPAGAATGNVVVTVGGVASNGVTFSVTVPPPNITSLNPTSAVVGASVTISGANFGASQGTSTVAFNGTLASPASWSATSITVPVPSGATTGNVVVTVGGVASNGLNFTVLTPPSITSLTPSSATVGTSITIAGSNFGASQGTSTVTFNGTAATPANWTSTSIAVPVPVGASSGNVVVTVGGLASNAVPFTVVIPPSITSLTPNSGVIGASVTIAGSNFGSTQGTSTVTFNGITATPTSWGATSIAVPVPNGATTGNVVVTVGGIASNGVNFTVTSPGPSLSTLGLTQGPVGAVITITGSNFGAAQGTSTVTFNGTLATPTTWSDTSIDAPVPAGATTGNVVVTVGGIASNGLLFTVTPPPNISSIVPTSGPVGTVVTVNGTNFGPTVGTRVSSLLFNGLAARTTSWNDTQIVAPVPIGATTGNVVVNISGVSSNGINFTVTTGPQITGLSPTSGPVGTSVAITGTSFGSTQGSSSVTFNGTSANPTSWSDTSIVVPVPSAASSGNVVVTVGGTASNAVSFTVTTAVPIRLVQHIAVDAGTTNSASLAFPSNNTAGNFIAVVIRAGKNGQTFTVSDSHSNPYKQAVLLNMTGDAETIGIYYAENIAGGPNSVTITDNLSPSILRFSIMEYSGVMLSNSLDAAIAREGIGTNATSGNTVTAWGGDLLLGEITTGSPASFTAGTGYKIEDSVPAAPNAKLIDEDQIQLAAGTASASAVLGASDNWGAALAAFKSANGIMPQNITVAVSPSTASLSTGVGTQSFTAQLTNDVQNRGVTWSLSGAGCSGATCGTLSLITTTSVTYTAPPSVPNPATVSLIAASITDNTKTSTATITLVAGAIAVTMTPKRGSVTMSQTQQFTATVFNDPNHAGVTWQVDGNTGGNSASGTISATGLFTPGTQAGLHTITATSVTNASASASVTFAVTDLQGVYTYHNDVGRTGQNTLEYALTPANVNSGTFSQLFSCPVDGYVYAQPLYAANLTIGGVKHNVLFIATEHDSVYAFDADSASCVQLWKTSFLGTGVTTMPWQDTSAGTGFSPTNDVFPEIGITSTPVIDPATGTIYVAAKTKETVGSGCSSGSPCYINRLHALNVTTGAEKFGGPVAITAKNFVSLRHFTRPALLLSNNTVYVSFGSHGDIPNWQGWLFAYDAGTLAQKWVFSTSDPVNGNNGASIWSGGDGPAADASGNIFVSTGNGSYDGTKNFSESALKISPAGGLLDWFTPFNRATLDANDIDLSSAGILILPDSVGSVAHPHLALATGKIAILYLLDQTNMGRFNSVANQDVQEVIPVPPPNTTQLDGGIYGVPAYWNGNIYSTGQSFPLSQFTISNGVIATPQFADSPNLFPPRGGIPAVSASGSTNGIVWILDLSAWATSGPAILDAYDATDVTRLLYSSPASGSGAAGPSVKFTVPTVANGKVYVGGQSVFTVFGLLPN